MNNGDLLPEIKRRICLGWTAFGKVDNIMRSRKISMKIKRKMFNEYILPVMTYGCKTWALNNGMIDKLAVAQRKIKRIMLGITLRNQKCSNWITQQMGVADIIERIRKTKHRWAGHVARLIDNRWTIKTTEWTPRNYSRKPGRPKTRWRDDRVNEICATWSRLAKNRSLWKIQGGAPPAEVNHAIDVDIDSYVYTLYLALKSVYHAGILQFMHWRYSLQ